MIAPLSEVLVIAMLMLVGAAHAQALALDPLNRVHAGVSLSDGETLGAQVGLDSRLTRLIFVDAGAWFSPMTLPEMTVDEANDSPGDWFRLRHGLYVAPGLRIPHRYGKGINWDLIWRAGFGALWLADASYDDELQANPSLLGGGDFIVRKDAVGVRLGGKGMYAKPYSGVARQEVVIVRAQWAAEVFYQW